jgi:hypothetical protein
MEKCNLRENPFPTAAAGQSNSAGRVLIVENAENAGNNFEPPALSRRRCRLEPNIEARHLRAGCDLLCRGCVVRGSTDFEVVCCELPYAECLRLD